MKSLPLDELLEVLQSDNRASLVIAGFVDPTIKAMTLYCGDFRKVTVPLSIFKPNEKGPIPDSTSFAITDFGQTIRLGDYEAATDAVLDKVGC